MYGMFTAFAASEPIIRSRGLKIGVCRASRIPPLLNFPCLCVRLTGTRAPFESKRIRVYVPPSYRSSRPSRPRCSFASRKWSDVNAFTKSRICDFLFLYPSEEMNGFKLSHSTIFLIGWTEL